MMVFSEIGVFVREFFGEEDVLSEKKKEEEEKVREEQPN